MNGTSAFSGREANQRLQLQPVYITRAEAAFQGQESATKSHCDWISNECECSHLQQHFLVDLTPYDVIIGYRADDSYFTFAQDFVAGAISLAKLSEAMRLGKLGEQIVLKSDRAYERLRFIGAEKADAKTWYEKKTIRDREARRAYRSTRKATDNVRGLYMLDIMREGIRNGDPRLR